MHKVSIIVPVYKAERYLRQCIESVISQTFVNWELLLIDDGSPDDSGIICDEYAKRDNRIVVLHKPNGGVSSARNLGLEYATGEWIAFLDADDLFYSNALEVLINTAEDNMLDLLQFYCNRSKLSFQEGILGSSIMTSAEYWKSNLLGSSVWESFVNTKVIKNNNIRFDTSLKLGEDQLFNFELVRCSSRIKRINTILYYYRANEFGAISTWKAEDRKKTILAYIEYKKNYRESELFIDKCNFDYLLQLIITYRIPYSEAKDIYESSVFSQDFIGTHIKRCLMALSRRSFLLMYIIIRLYGFVNN